MKKWNYKTVTIKRINDICDFNKEGEDGWELISILPLDNGYGYKGVFKREVEEGKQSILTD
jgi:hypothetical protein